MKIISLYLQRYKKKFKRGIALAAWDEDLYALVLLFYTLMHPFTLLRFFFTH